MQVQKVTGGPAEKVIQSDVKDPTGKSPRLSFGVKVPWKVEVEGDITKCHCKYIDKGTVGYKFVLHGPNTPTVTKNPTSVDGINDPIPCSYSEDLPGAFFTGTFPATGSADVTILYDLKMTLVCEDDDKAGTKSDSVTLNGRYFNKGVKW